MLQDDAILLAIEFTLPRICGSPREGASDRSKKSRPP